MKQSTNSCVLFSGGWDSVACALMYKDSHNPDLLFVNYGQNYLLNEVRSAKAFAEHQHMRLIQKQFPLQHDQERRNFYLMSFAKLQGYETIIMGSRNFIPLFDKYKDSNWWSLKRYAAMMNVEVLLPITGWDKKRIVSYVRDLYPNRPYNCYANSADFRSCKCPNCTELRNIGYGEHDHL